MYRSPASRSKDNETQTRFTKLIEPKSILCVKKGFESFNGSHIFPSKASEMFFRDKREEAQRVIAINKLSLDTPLSDSLIDKSGIWRESIRPQVDLVREALRFCTGFIEECISTRASLGAVDDWIAQLRAETTTAENDALRRQRMDKARLREMHAKQLGVNESVDIVVTIRLVKAARDAIETSLAKTSGFLYSKVWVMPDGTRW